MVWIDYCFGSKLLAEGFRDKALGRRLSLGLGLRSFGFGLKVGV